MPDDFDALLRLHPRGEASFENEPTVHGHLYGGYSMALAVRAAARTVSPGLQLHHAQAVFPTGGELGAPLQLSVQAVGDDRSRAVRVVTVRQGRNTPLLLTASFSAAGRGPELAQQPSEPVPVGPEAIAPDQLLLQGLDPFEIRPAGRHRVDAGSPLYAPLHPYWVRPHLALPDDPGLHAGVVAFASDYMVITAAQVPDAPPPPAAGTRSTTMDHSLWLHRSVDAGQWLLYSAEPVSIHGGRGVTRGIIRTRNGSVVASFVQQALTTTVSR